MFSVISPHLLAGRKVWGANQPAEHEGMQPVGNLSLHHCALPQWAVQHTGKGYLSSEILEIKNSFLNLY